MAHRLQALQFAGQAGHADTGRLRRLPGCRSQQQLVPIGNAQLLHRGHRQAHRQTISLFGWLQARPVGLALEALHSQRKLLGTSGM